MSAVLNKKHPAKDSRPVRDRVSKEEWQLRVDLAACYQIASILKWTDLIYTHFSARLIGHDEFLINPYGLLFDEITASNLIKVDHKGNVLDDPLICFSNSFINAVRFLLYSARSRPMKPSR